MTERPVAPPAPVRTPAPETLEWSVDPWRERPLRALTGFIAALALSLLAVRLAPVPLVGWALALSLLALLAPAFLPVRCRVDAEGLARRIGLGWERRAWNDVRRARITADGLYVSSLRHGGPLEPFRGLLLPLPRSVPETLQRALARAVEAHGV